MTEVLQSSLERAHIPSRHDDAIAASGLNAQNPWPGLDAYDETSRDFFNGRSEEAAELLRLIRLAPLTVLYGKSGLGKSSLLQAGLFPLLRAAHYLPVNLRLDPGDADPALESVARRLVEELARTKAEFPECRDDNLWEYLHRRDLELWTIDNFPLTPVLVFDQFEELFSHGGGHSGRIQLLFDNLGDLIENRIPAELCNAEAKPKRAKLDLLSQRYRVVLSFREDFLPQVRTWERKVPSLLRNYLRLEPMSRQRAIEAVERSGAQVIEDGVAPIIVDFVGKADETGSESATAEPVIEPVLLSLCCYQLNRRRDGKRIDKALVDRAGRDILDGFYREALDDKDVEGPPDVSDFIENFLIQGDHFRGSYPKEEALNKKHLTEKQLTALTNRHRLLRVIPADTARIELIHDRLVPVVRKSRDERKARQNEQEQERKAKEAQDELERERSRRKEVQRERDKFKLMLAVTSAAAMVILGLFFYTWRLQQEKLVQEQKTTQLQQAQAQLESELRIQLQKSFQSLELREQTGRLQQITEIARKTFRIGEGGIALQPHASPEDQVLYQGLAAYRLAKAAERLPLAMAERTVPASLSALHSALEAAPHLRKIIRLRNAKPTSALAYSPDGRTLAAGDDDGSVHLIDTITYEEKRPLNCRHPSGTAAWTLAFSGDGQRLVVGFAPLTDDQYKSHGAVCVFDVVSESVVQNWATAEVDGKFGEIGSVYSVAYNRARPDEIVIASGDMVFIGNVQSGELRPLPKKGKGEIVAISISASGRAIAAAGEDNIIRVWNLDAPNKEPVPLEGHRGTVQTIMFLPGNDSIIVSAGDDRNIMVWKVLNAKEGCETLSAQQPAAIYGLDIITNRDGRMLAVARADRKVRLHWLQGDLSSCKIKKGGQKPLDGRASPRGQQRSVPELKDVPDGELSGHGGAVMAVAFHPNGQRLASSSMDGSVRFWGPKTDGFSLAELRADDGEMLPGNVTTVVIHPDGTSIAAGDDKGNIYLWPRKEYGEPEFQRAAWKRNAHASAVRALAYVRIGSRLALVSGGDDGVLKRWDAESGANIPGDMADNAEPVRAIAVSRERTMLAAGSRDGTVRIWNPQTSAPLQRIRPNGWNDLAAVGFGPDAKHLIIGSSSLWLVPLQGDGETVEADNPPLNGHLGGIQSVAQLRNQDGRMLSAGIDGMLLVWKLERRREDSGFYPKDEFEYRMKTRDGRRLTTMDASANGRLILTGGEKGQVQLWDAIHKELIAARFKAHGEDITAVALAPDGNFFVTAEARKILLWPGPDRWADMVCQKLSWNMSDQQWKDLVSASLHYEDQCDLPRE